jgi:hypothetical protein
VILLNTESRFLKKALFYPLHETSMEKFLQLVGLDTGKKLYPIFVLSGPRLTRYIPRLLDHEVEVWHVAEKGDSFGQVLDVGDIKVASLHNNPVAGTSPADDSRVRRVARGWVGNIPLLARIKEYIYTTRKCSREVAILKFQYKQIRELVSAVKPEVAIMCGDRHLSYEPAFIRVCSELSIPIKIPPVSIASMPDQIVRGRVERGFGAFVSSQIPWQYLDTKQYRINTCGSYVSFYELWRLEALRKCGMLSDNPWVIGGSGKVTIFVPGSLVASKLESAGLKRSVMVITGDPDLDYVMASISKRRDGKIQLLKNHKFRQDRLFLGVSLPQYLEHKLLDSASHWRDIELLCKMLSNTGQNILVSLHPKMNYEEYQFLERKYNLTIALEPLNRWIGVLDIYTASEGSSTLLWSLLAGIPTIAVDWLKFGNCTMDVHEGKVVVESPDEYNHELVRLLSDMQNRKGFSQAAYDAIGLGRQSYSSANSSVSIINELLR